MQKEGFTCGPLAFEPEVTRVIYRQQTRPGYLTQKSGDVGLIAEDNVPVTWVRHTEATTLLVFKGRTVDRLQTLSDFYGFATSIKDEDEEFETHRAAWQIEKEDSLELVVIASIIDTPTLGFDHVDYSRNYYKPVVHADLFEFSERAKLGLPFTMDNFDLDDRRIIRPITHGLTKIRSSKWSAQQMHDAEAEFRKKAAAVPRQIYDSEEYDIGT